MPRPKVTTQVIRQKDSFYGEGSRELLRDGTDRKHRLWSAQDLQREINRLRLGPVTPEERTVSAKINIVNNNQQTGWGSWVNVLTIPSTLRVDWTKGTINKHSELYEHYHPPGLSHRGPGTMIQAPGTLANPKEFTLFQDRNVHTKYPVSYTHLTLPTKA